MAFLLLLGVAEGRNGFGNALGRRRSKGEGWWRSPLGSLRPMHKAAKQNACRRRRQIWLTDTGLDRTGFGLTLPSFKEIRVKRRSRRLREPAWGMAGTPSQRAAAKRRLASLLAGLTGILGRLSASAIVGPAPDRPE